MNNSLIDNINISYKRIFHSLKKYSAPNFERLGLTKVDASVIMMLDRENEQSKSQLARNLSFEPNALTRSLDRLVDLDYVKRIINEGDRRFVKLSLTPKGKKLAHSYTQIMRKFWIKGLKGISENEIKSLEDVLHKIYLNISDKK